MSDEERVSQRIHPVKAFDSRIHKGLRPAIDDAKGRIEDVDVNRVSRLRDIDWSHIF